MALQGSARRALAAMSTVSAATTAWHTALSSTATRRLDAAGQQQHPHPALDLRERMSAAPFVNPYDAMLSRAFDAIPCVPDLVEFGLCLVLHTMR